MKTMETDKNIEFINGVFDLCMKYFAKENIHYQKEDNCNIWENDLHNTIQEACNTIISAFENK